MTDNLHDEQLFAYKVRHALEHGADNLDGITRTKLQAARQNALAHQKTTAVAGLSLAGVGNFTSNVLLPQARTLVALLALSIGVAGTYYWNNFQQAEDNEEIDSALLAADLPINAYLDHGFHAWLEQPTASEPSQSPQE
jgi:hypothetical protein